MKISRDPNIDHMTLGEVQTERGKLLPKILKGEATLRDCRKFLQFSGMVGTFESATITARELEAKVRKQSMGR